MRKLLVTTALLTAAATASATTWQVDLDQHLIGRTGSPPSASGINPAPSFSGDTGDIPEASCTYNDVTQVLACDGILHLRSSTGPSAFSRVFDRYITDLNIDLAEADPTATAAFLCENNPGTSQAAGFGSIVGANICGNYTLGGNGTDDSTVTYGPGLALSRVMGGDDVVSGPQQSIADYELSLASFDPDGNLVIQSSDWDAVSSAGTQLTFIVGDPIAIATDDEFDAPQDVQVDFDVLANDDGFIDPVTVTITTQPGKGTATVTGSPGAAADLRIEYTANAGATGQDTLVYEVTDGTNTKSATVTINILEFGANDASRTTSHRTPVAISLAELAVGFSDPVNVTISNGPDQGTVDVIGNDGPVAGISIEYTPASAVGTSGYQTTFDYTVDDGVLPDTGTITITVTNNQPVAGNGTITISTEGEDPDSVSGTFVAPGAGGNIGDGPSTIEVVTPPSDGSVELNGTTFTYTPNADFYSGTDSFTYRITDDDEEESTPGTVTINIANVSPSVTAPAITIQSGTTGTSNITVEAGNGPLDEHTVEVSGGTQGTCTLNGNTVTYTASDGAEGTDSCTVTVTDLDDSSDSATINVTLPASDVVRLPGGGGAMDLWSLMLLGGLPLLGLRRRRS